MPAITASSSTSSSARPPSSCGRAPRGYATSGACLSPPTPFQLAARCRDPGDPHGPPHRQRPMRWLEIPAPTRRSSGCCTLSLESHPDHALAKTAAAGAARAPSSASESRAAGPPARSSSRRCGWSAISPNVGDAKYSGHPSRQHHPSADDAAQAQGRRHRSKEAGAAVDRIEAAADITERPRPGAPHFAEGLSHAVVA